MKGLFLTVWLAATLLPAAWICWRSGLLTTPFALVDSVGVLLGDRARSGPLVAALLQAGLAAGLALAIAWPAALALAQWRFHGSRPGRRLLWWARLCPTALLATALSQFATWVPEWPAVVKVALAHLVFNVPVAVFVMATALARVPPALAWEARQDDLGAWRRARLVWGRELRAAGALALLCCCAASLGEAALTRALAGEGTLAVTLPGPELADRAAVAALALGVALVWSVLLGAWWSARTSTRIGAAED